MPNKQWFMKALRQELGLRQEDVARIAGHGIDQFRISALERGEDGPTEQERQALLRPFIARSAGRAMEKLIIAATEEN